MKNTSLALVLLILTSCNRESAPKDNVSQDALMESEFVRSGAKASRFVMTSSGSLKPSTAVILNGITFKIVQDQQGDTIYRGTRDSAFETPEGYSIGDSIGMVQNSYRELMYKEPGFGYFIPLPSGWTLGFCQGATCTSFEPKTKDSARWIFKRE
jgi:hypothetical protein